MKEKDNVQEKFKEKGNYPSRFEMSFQKPHENGGIGFTLESHRLHA